MILYSFSRLIRTPTCDGRTDRRTDTRLQLRAGKKSYFPNIQTDILVYALCIGLNALPGPPNGY